MTVQASTCIHDAELRLRPDGTVYACHVSQQINASVGPEAKNRNVVCAAGSYVEFHYNGHLSYCDKLAKAGSYLQGHAVLLRRPASAVPKRERRHYEERIC